LEGEGILKAWKTKTCAKRARITPVTSSDSRLSESVVYVREPIPVLAYGHRLRSNGQGFVNERYPHSGPTSSRCLASALRSYLAALRGILPSASFFGASRAGHAFAFHPDFNANLFGGSAAGFSREAIFGGFVFFFLGSPLASQKIRRAAFASDSEIRSPSTRAASNTVRFSKSLAGLRPPIEIHPTATMARTRRAAGRFVAPPVFPRAAEAQVLAEMQRAGCDFQGGHLRCARDVQSWPSSPFRIITVGIRW